MWRLAASSSAASGSPPCAFRPSSSPASDSAPRSLSPQCARRKSLRCPAPGTKDSAPGWCAVVIVSPGKAGGFSCEPLKAACRDVAATRPLGPPYGWLLHPDGSELACTLAMPTPGQFRPGPSQLDRTASSIPPTARGAGSRPAFRAGRKTGRNRHSRWASSTLRSTGMGVSLVMLEPPTWGSSPLYSRNCQTLGAAPAKPGGLPRLR